MTQTSSAAEQVQKNWPRSATFKSGYSLWSRRKMIQPAPAFAIATSSKSE
jgi:hypothetical protein